MGLDFVDACYVHLCVRGGIIGQKGEGGRGSPRHDWAWGKHSRG